MTIIERKTARINRLLWAPGLMIAWSLVVCVYWVLDREPPVKIIGTHIEGALHPNGYAMITLDIERSPIRSCSLNINRWIQSSKGFRWQLAPRYVSVAEYDNVQVSQPDKSYVAVDLPPVAPVGKTIYGATLYYYCNPLHHWTNSPIVVSYELAFEITPKPP